MTPAQENSSGAGVFVVGTEGSGTGVPEKVCVAALPKKGLLVNSWGGILRRPPHCCVKWDFNVLIEKSYFMTYK